MVPYSLIVYKGLRWDTTTKLLVPKFCPKLCVAGFELEDEELENLQPLRPPNALNIGRAAPCTQLACQCYWMHATTAVAPRPTSEKARDRKVSCTCKAASETRALGGSNI